MISIHMIINKTKLNHLAAPCDTEADPDTAADPTVLGGITGTSRYESYLAPVCMI